MQIQPKSFGDNLNEWFRSMGNTWQPLLVVCALVYVPLGIVTVVLFFLPGVQDAYFDLLLLEGENPDLSTLLELLAPILWAGLVWTLLQIVATVLIYIAVGRAVATRANGADADGLDVLRFGVSRLGTGLAAAFALFVAFVLVTGMVTLIGWLLIASFGAEFFSVFLTTVAVLTVLVAVVWVAVGVSLYLQVIAMEDASPSEALIRSFRLVRGRWWPTLGFLLVTALIVSAGSQVVSIVLVPVLVFGIIAPGVLAIAYGLATMLQGPFTAIIALAYSVWYVDLRAREGSVTTEDLV